MTSYKYKTQTITKSIKCKIKKNITQNLKSKKHDTTKTNPRRARLCKNQKKAFFHKLLIFFILIAIIPPLILTFLGYTFSSKILQDAIYDQAYDSVIQINDSINDFLMEYKTVIDIVEQDIPLQEVLSKKSLLGRLLL